MFVKQVNKKTALELAAKGHEIKVLVPSPTGNWVDMLPQTLDKMLSDCLFFRSEAAMIDPEFEAVVQEMISQSPPPTSAISCGVYRQHR